MKNKLQPVLIAVVFGYLAWATMRIVVAPHPHVAGVPW